MRREQTFVGRRMLGCISEGHGDRPVKSRGLCGGCYNGYLADVESGAVTWFELEELGLSVPSDTASARLQRARELKKQSA